MIKIRIKNADHEIDIRFPISESELFAKLGEIHAVEGRDAAQSALVTDVYWPEEFSMLKDRFANLDELNYLGKRMESFDTLEYDQFLIGISKLDSKDVKDLINLTFNLNHFTLCQDVSSYGKIGREYVLNTEGAVPAHDEDDPKYATIGKDLIDRGLAQITERGLLIYNPFDELEEVYDGHTFPEYYYNNSLLSLNAEYGGRTELLQLPDEALAIKKAIDRLGAPSAEDCSYTVTFHNFKGDDWLARVQEIIAKEGIYETNAMLKALDVEGMDWSKLSAVVELVDVQKASNIAFLAEHLDEFSFIPEAKTEEDVGHFLVDNISEYRLNLEMEDYFDFSGTIDTIPEIPGLAVWHEGHIGIYIGNGQVIHASGTKAGVIQTPIGNSGWTHWLKIPYITYYDNDITEAPNEDHIWEVLYAKIGNPYGAAGLMGNLYAESGLQSNNLQNSYEESLGYSDASYTQAVDSGSYTNFTSDSAGYGLAQWTVEDRKTPLLAFANERGCSIADLDMQLAFLCDELETKFPGVLSALKNAKSVREASDYVLFNFEAPLDQGETVQAQRAANGSVYYSRYGQ